MLELYVICGKAHQNTRLIKNTLLTNYSYFKMCVFKKKETLLPNRGERRINSLGPGVGVCKTCKHVIDGVGDVDIMINQLHEHDQ